MDGQTGKRLKLFRVGYDVVSAYDEADAKSILKDAYGYTDEDFEDDEEFVEISDFKDVTVTWTDGDFELDKRDVDYPERSVVEFVAVWLNPYSGSVPRFELDKVSFRDGHIRVRALACDWAALRRGVVCSSEY